MYNRLLLLLRTNHYFSFMKVPVLFTSSNSVYNDLNCDCYDLKRNALTYQGQAAVIAHPPCRSWGKLSHFAKPLPGEKDLSLWAVNLVRTNGGILEHPGQSRLFKEVSAGTTVSLDKWGGYTINIFQFWFGHVCEKRTTLYIVGIPWDKLPPLPFQMGFPTHTIKIGDRSRKGLKLATKQQREYTPVKLAKWLIEVCLLIENNKK